MPESFVIDRPAKINCIIFSMDRAMQLDGMLRSLFRSCKDIERADLSVLYKTTDERHACQYQTLASEYAGRVVFVKQLDFRRDLLSSLCASIKEDTKSMYTTLSSIGSIGFSLGSFLDRIWRRTFGQLQRMIVRLFTPALPNRAAVLFLVDDNFFVRDFLLGDLVEVLDKQSDLIGFSLRLGENTTHCYPRNQAQALPRFIPVTKDILKFDWTSSEYDFGYPLELSSSMYRLKDILPLVMSFAFEDPNSLEERMAFNAKAFRSSQPFLGCFRHSVAFCNPVNMVQTTVPNRAGEKFGHAIDDLSARFERGERIRVETFGGFVPNACHQEVELVFEKVEK